MPQLSMVLVLVFVLGTVVALLMTSCTLYCVIFRQRFKYSSAAIAPVVVIQPTHDPNKKDGRITTEELKSNFGGIWMGENYEEATTVSKRNT